MDEFKEQLIKHLEQFETIPFLFVGSGLSRRYLGLEGWSSLLQNVASHVGLPMHFNYYQGQAKRDLAKVASEMSNDFSKTWWSQEKFIESRQAFADFATSNDSPLKYEICQYIINKSKNIKEGYEKELELFKKVSVGGIVTTNWDQFLESLFPKFTTYIGQEELLFFDKIAIGDIFKIHGCVSNPNSLILTDQDYEDFNKRNPYLAAKLLTIFVEQPVFFLGYGIGDKNIQEILHSILSCISQEKLDKLKNRLIFCQWVEGIAKPVIEDHSFFTPGNKNIIPMKLIKLDSYIPLYEVLEERKNKIPIKVLKNMQNMVYEFIKSYNPRGKVYVSDDLDKLENEHDVEFVYGVGVMNRLSSIGAKQVGQTDLVKDILEDNKWNHHFIATEVLPRVCVSNTKFIPFFKYLRKAGYLDEKGFLYNNGFWPEEFVKKVNAITQSAFYPSAANYLVKRDDINRKYQSLQELLDNESFFHCLIYIPFLEGNKIDVDVLESFLKSHNSPEVYQNKHGTYFKRAICFYDYLKYKLKPAQSVEFLGPVDDLKSIPI